MSIQTDTRVSNRLISDELKRLLLDLASHIHDTYEIVKKIKTKAHEEGFNDDEIHKLLKDHLRKFLDRNQVNYILYVKDQRKEKKEAEALTNQQNDDKNVPALPAPDYNMISIDQDKAHEQLTQEQEEQSEKFESYKQNYVVEFLSAQLEITNANLDRVIAEKKALEDKYKQLQAETKANTPGLQDNNLRTKVIVSQIFRDFKLQGIKNDLRKPLNRCITK